MAYWNIGIDESGSFTYYHGNASTSFVCASITQETPDKLKEKFNDIYYSLTERSFRNECDLLGFFHAMQRDEKENKWILGGIKDLVYKAVVSQGRPLVLGNPQHWWVSAVMSVLRHVLALDEIKQGDQLDIYVATRNSLVIGTSDADWKTYHMVLQEDLRHWIKKLDKKGLNIRLYCMPADRSSSVTFADQTVAMVRRDRLGYLGEKLQYVRCDDLYEVIDKKPQDVVQKGEEADVAQKESAEVNVYGDLLKSENYLSAVQYLLRAYLAKENVPFKMFHEIFSKAFIAGHPYVDVWKSVLDTCEYALDSRGSSPELTDRVFKIAEELQKESGRIGLLSLAQRTELGIDIHLLMDIWRVLSKVSSHRGDTSCDVLDIVDRFWENGNQEIGSTLDRWKLYLQTKLIGAQIPFNGYDFACVANRMEPLLDCHEKFCELPFPFAKTTIDDELAALLGTCGQAAAFQGDLDEAVNCFEEDYACSSVEWKPMPASFMVTVLHRMCDFERACEWFEKQTDGISFNDFGKSLSATSDLWQMVNYFKLLVLGQLLEQSVLRDVPDLESWNIQNTYPWPLVLKWAALSLFQREHVDRGVVLLEEAKKLLKKGGFAIKTLSLPILQMLYCVTEDEGYKKEYKGLLQQLTDTCETFKIYVESHGDAFKLNKDKDLWEAAMILPFNYA